MLVFKCLPVARRFWKLFRLVDTVSKLHSHKGYRQETDAVPNDLDVDGTASTTTMHRMIKVLIGHSVLYCKYFS